MDLLLRFFIKNNKSLAVLVAAIFTLVTSTTIAQEKLPKLTDCEATGYISYKWNKNTSLTRGTDYKAYKKFICKSAFEGFLAISGDEIQGFKYQIIDDKRNALSRKNENACKTVSNYCRR